jgi:phosphoribosylamine--glycine ligase
VILPLLETDLADIFTALAEQKLSDIAVRWRNKSTLCVVLASGGYPGAYSKGKPIEMKPSAASADVTVYHAGAELINNQLVTAGGRVLGVTGIGDTFEMARDKAYKAIEAISFDGMIYRKDIGHKAMAAAGGRR